MLWKLSILFPTQPLSQSTKSWSSMNVCLFIHAVYRDSHIFWYFRASSQIRPSSTWLSPFQQSVLWFGWWAQIKSVPVIFLFLLLHTKKLWFIIIFPWLLEWPEVFRFLKNPSLFFIHSIESIGLFHCVF